MSCFFFVLTIAKSSLSRRRRRTTMEDRRVGVRIVTRKKKRQRRKASINQIPEATKKGKATAMTMTRMIFHQYSKGRVLFTSSPSGRVRVVQEDLPGWLSTRTTTMTMMCSRRLWARWKILGEGQMLESNERLFLLTVKILIRVQERNSSCLNIFYVWHELT